MKRQFTYDVKLVVQHIVKGTLEFVSRSFQAEIEMEEHDYYFPFTVSNNIVKKDMEDALKEFAITNGYNLNELQVIKTEVSTNEEYIDISFSDNDADNVYDRNPEIEVEFIPQIFKPRTPSHFTGDIYSNADLAILWIWEDVPGCAFRLYDENNSVIAEIGLGYTEYIETNVERGINYVRKIVAFNMDGESNPSEYRTVMIPSIEIDDSLISEHRFGYVDITPVSPVQTQVKKLSTFKSGIGDNLDLHVDASPYSVYEQFDFDTVIEGYTVSKQKHFTEVMAKYKLTIEGMQETDGDIASKTVLSIVPWPVINVSCRVNSVIYSAYRVNYSCDFNLGFWKKRPVFVGGNNLPSIDLDEEKPWFPELPGNGGGSGGPGGGESTPINPGDIHWEQIGGSGSANVGDHNITGEEIGDVTLEGTLPNGDKVIVNVEILPPTFELAGGTGGSGGGTGGPDDQVEDGMDGNGGGLGGGLMTPEGEDDFVGDHGCPCLYVYKTCKFTLRLLLKNNIRLDNTLAVFDDYDRNIISIDNNGVVTGLEVGLTHVKVHYKGGFLCFHVRVLEITMSLIPNDPDPIRVDDSLLFRLRKANYIVDNEYIEWSCSDIASIGDDGNLTGEIEGKYTVSAKHRGQTISTKGLIIAPDMEWDFSTSPAATNRYKMKVDNVVLALVEVNEKLINNSLLTFEMEDTSIATIDADGYITGVKAGETKLNATYKGYTITCIVEIVSTLVTVTPRNQYSDDIDFGIKLHQQQQICVYEDGIRVKDGIRYYTPSDSVFTVDNDGLVSANAIGESYVNVTYKTYSFKLIGIVINSTLTISPEKVSVVEKSSTEFDVLLDGEKLYYGVNFSDYETKNIGIDYNSVLNGYNKGNGTFTASYKGLTASAEWEVTKRTTNPGDEELEKDYTSYYIKPNSIDVTYRSGFKLFGSYKDEPLTELDSSNDIWAAIGNKGRFTTTSQSSYLAPLIDTIDFDNGTCNPKSWDYPYHGIFTIKVLRKRTGYFDKYIYQNIRIEEPKLAINASAKTLIRNENDDLEEIISLYMYKPDDNTDSSILTSTQASTKVVTLAGYFDINPEKVKYSVVDSSIATVDELGNITPRRAGTTYLIAKSLGVSEEIRLVVKDFYRVVRIDENTDSVMDVHEELNIRMERNGVLLSPNVCIFKLVTSAIRTIKPGHYVGYTGGSITIYVTHNGIERSYYGTVNTPTIRVEILHHKEPEAISTKTGNPWPDLYKVDVNTTLRYEVFINDVKIELGEEKFYPDTRFYGNNCTFGDGKIICNNPGIIRGEVLCRDVYSNIFEIEVGTFIVELTSENFFPGNTVNFKIVESKTNTELPVISFVDDGDFYCNYQYIEQVSDDVLCGKTLSLSDVDSTSGYILQGGLNCKMAVVYVPKDDDWFGSIDDAYEDRFRISYDYRPRVFESKNYHIDGFSNGTIYVDGIKVNDGDNIPMGCDPGDDNIGPGIKAYNSNKLSIATGYGRRNGDNAYCKLKAGENLWPNDSIVENNALEDKAILRASGFAKNITVDARRRIEFGSITTCGCSDKVNSSSGRFTIFDGNIGDEASYYALENRIQNSHLKGYYDYPNKPYYCYYSSFDTIPKDKFTVIIEDESVASVELLSSSKTRIRIKWLSPGSTLVKIVPDESIADLYMPKEFYVHTYASKDSDPFLDGSMNYDIAFLGQPMLFQAKYDGEIVPSKHTAFFVTGDDAMDENYNVIFNTLGSREVNLEYRNLRHTQKVHVLSSKEPTLFLESYGSIPRGREDGINVKIDGFSSINDIPCSNVVTWYSSNPYVLEINDCGRILAKNIGKATITARFLNSQISQEIEVVGYSEDHLYLYVEEGHIPIYKDKKLVLSFRACYNSNPSNLVSCRWYINDEEVSTSNKITIVPSDSESEEYINVVCSYNQANGTRPPLQGATSISFWYYPKKTGHVELNMPKSREIQTFGLRNAIRMFDNNVSDISNDDENSYFYKSKKVRYDGFIDITKPIVDVNVCDIIPTSQEIDEELALIDADKISINSVDFLSCDNTNAVLLYDKTNGAILMSCDDRTKLFRAVSSHNIELDVVTNPKGILVEHSQLVYKNYLGVTYTGDEDADTTFVYGDDVDLSVLTCDNGMGQLDHFVGKVPAISAAIARPKTVNHSIALDNTHKEGYFICDELFEKNIDKYMIEITKLTTTGNAKTEYSDNLETIVHNSKTFIKMDKKDNGYIKVIGIPEIVKTPYTATSEDFIATINGKKPMIKDGDGIEPYVSVSPSFNVGENRIVDYKIEVVVLDTYGNNIDVHFDNEISDKITTIDGDILRFTSNDFEMVDTLSSVTCSTTKSAEFELASNFEESIISPLYNPYHSSKWKGVEFVMTKVSAISRNPNVVVYPVQEDIDFKSKEYADIFEIPYEFRAFILSPSQGCWSPVINPGYYYTNNDEYFLYNRHEPSGGIKEIEVYDVKKFYASIEAQTETVSEHIDTKANLDLADGILTNVVLNSGKVIIAPTVDAGSYETGEYRFVEPMELLEIRIDGELFNTGFECSVLLGEEWTSFNKYTNLQSIETGSANINGVKIRCNMKRAKDSSPSIKSITVIGKTTKWKSDNSFNKTLLCEVPYDAVKHSATDETLLEIMRKELDANGRSENRITNITVKIVDNAVDIEYSQDGSTTLLASSLETRTIMTTANFIHFNDNGEGEVSPIPRLGRPICILNKGLSLKHITNYDEKGNLSHKCQESTVFNGIPAITITHHDFDQLIVTCEDKEIAIKEIVNNIIYLDPTVKINKGDIITASYYIKNSFLVDYNYNIAENKSKISIYLSEHDNDYSAIQVFYETLDEGEYYAKELEINPLYNPINSGFVYLADEPNVPDDIILNCSHREFKLNDFEQTYVLINVVDKLGNQVPNIPVSITTEHGKMEMLEAKTNDLGVLSACYTPPQSYVGEDKVTVKYKDIAAEMIFKIRDIQPPSFLIAKPKNGEYIVKNGVSTNITVDLYEDGLIPIATETIRAMVESKPETTTTAVTNSNGHCELTIRPTVNSGYDICRIEITYKGIKEYLDLKVVI